jgi:hypothetical protein
MAEAPLRVLIAGGGVAALETVMALGALAGDDRVLQSPRKQTEELAR